MGTASGCSHSAPCRALRQLKVRHHLLGHIERFLHDYICQYWEVLHQAQFNDPVFGFLVMLEKGHRRQVPALETT